MSLKPGVRSVKDKRLKQRRAAGELAHLMDAAQRAAQGEDVDGEFRAGAESAGWRLLKALFFAAIMEEDGFGNLLREFLDKLCDPRDPLRQGIPQEAWSSFWTGINGLRHARRTYLERVREQQEDQREKEAAAAARLAGARLLGDIPAQVVRTDEGAGK